MRSAYDPIDYTLISGCINNNRNSQKQLYNILSPSLFSLILKQGFDQKEAEEILERVFIEIFYSINTFDTRLSFKDWYIKIYKDTIITIEKEGRGETKIVLIKYRDRYVK